MKSFKIWLEEKEVNKPYYRVINKAMYGSAGKWSDSPLASEIGPGTYWTPRWEGVLSMLASTFRQYSNGNLKDDDVWKTTVWQINKAIMEDPPKEHAWAFNYSSDVGEQVLVKALENPQIAKDPETGTLLKDILPKSFIFMSLLYKHLAKPPTIDYKSRGAEVLWNGRTVYLHPDYDNNAIVVKGEPDVDEPWNFPTVKIIGSMQEFEKFTKESKYVDPDSYGADSVDWFVHDMVQDGKWSDY